MAETVTVLTTGVLKAHLAAASVQFLQLLDVLPGALYIN